jgi:hypothetical protein
MPLVLAFIVFSRPESIGTARPGAYVVLTDSGIKEEGSNRERVDDAPFAPLFEFERRLRLLDRRQSGPEITE